jgi:hypothetical protein
MKRKVISQKSLPVRIPLLSTAVLYLLLDKFSAPEWVWASVGTLWGLLCVTAVIMLFTQETVDMFPGQPKDK